MPAVKQTKSIKPSFKSRFSDALISVLVTPLNLMAIGLRVLWSGRKLRLASLALLCAALVGSVFRFDMLTPAAEMVREQTYILSSAMGFAINDITVEGRKRTQAADLLAAIDAQQGGAIFALDLDEMHARVEALPWVQKAVVLRRLPNILHVKLTEREPFALYQENRQKALIDRNGVAITRQHLRAFEHLPTFSGEGSTLRASDLMDQLKEYPVLRNRMVAAHWTGGRRWTVRLDHGGKVLLPEGNIKGALNRLMQLEKDRRILAVENQAIDLRLPDRVLLRPDAKRSSQSVKPKLSSKVAS
ncbi:MAG: FtsQ-type POTRA domain-containing protein [Rhodobiaceae bacterium]|jgi:cell division protein FtsQ|nr:FtsQ-type POTRA domain-containing protein [Rhodobiaceae bacterium]